jgi:hypothetical protein
MAQAPPDKRDHEAAAQRPERRCHEILDRWVPTWREVLEVLQDAGIHPKAADDLRGPPPRSVAGDRNRRRPGIGHDVLNPTGESGSHHMLRGQERQDRKQDDAELGQGSD